MANGHNSLVNLNASGKLDLPTPGQVNREEILAEWEDNVNLEPINQYLNLDNIAELAPILPLLLRTQPKTRRTMHAVLAFYAQDPGNVALSTRAMCAKLGLDYVNWWRLTNVRPEIMKFINHVLVSTAQSYRGRVHVAAAEAGVTGGHQDRRLFFELTGDLKRGGGREGGGNITVVIKNDVITRPSGPVIEVSEP